MRYWLVVFLVLCFSVTLFSSEIDTLRIAAGNIDGVYYKLAVALKNSLEKELAETNIVIIQTSGSVQNAELLSHHLVDIAFMQNDVAYNYCNGEHGITEKCTTLKGLASLYTEVIQIVGKKSLFIQEISDLQNEWVAVGESNSGTHKNAIDILRASNLKQKDINPQYLAFSEIKTAFQNNTISAAFITAGLKFALLEDISETVNFIPLSKETLLILKEKYPYFVTTTIPAGTYTGQSEPVNTAGVRALLVAHQDLPSERAEEICHALFSSRAALMQTHPIASHIRLSSALRGMTLDLHPGAKEYYHRKSLFFGVISFCILLILGFLIVVFRKTVRLYLRKFVYQIRQNIHFRIAIIIVMLFVLGSVGSYYFEHSVNDQFDTIYKSFWASIVYLLSGFEIEPFTPGGRFSAFLLLLGGIGILGSVIGNIASIFMKEGVEKMPKTVKKHIAICNWNKRGHKIIEELHHPSAEPDTTILVLTDSEVNEKALREDSNRYANVYFIKGKPTTYKTLKDARVHMAKSVIILSDAADKEPDPKTVLTCLAIRQLQKESQESHSPHIIAELMDRDNRRITLDAGADEIVSAGFYRTGIMLQSARYHNLSDIFHELLIYEDNSSSIYIMESDKIPQCIIDKTFKEASELFNENRDEKNPVILIGVRRKCADGKSHVILNPMQNKNAHHGSFDTFRPTDALVVIAQSYPNLSNITEKMEKK